MGSARVARGRGAPVLPPEQFAPPSAAPCDHPLPGAALAQRLDELHRRDQERRERQRLHYELWDGSCPCPECVAEPVLVGVVVDDLFGALGGAPADVRRATP